MTPYFNPRNPPEFSATLPPMVDIFIEPGSGGYSSPAEAAISATFSVTTPASTKIVRFLSSSSSTRSIFTRHSTTQPGVGTLPPLSPVPEPRVTMGVLSARAKRTTRETSSVVTGNTTHAGSACNAAVPSKPYGIRCSGSKRTRFESRISTRPATNLLERSTGLRNIGSGPASRLTQ